MEFGAPHRTIREPVSAKREITPEHALRLRRRKISFYGDWSLLLYACQWSLRAWEFEASNDSTPLEMTPALEGLDGQYLDAVQYDEARKITTLIFDLGAKLQLWPNEDVEDNEAQWTLVSIDRVHRSFLLSGAIEVASGDSK